MFDAASNPAKLYNKETGVKLSFSDVAGLEEAKEEIMEFVSFLKFPEQYRALGAKVNNLAHTPTAGHGDLAAGDVRVAYSLGTSGGTKAVRYMENGLRVAVYHTAGFTEQIPLIIKDGDVIDVQEGVVTVTRGDVVMPKGPLAARSASTWIH